MESEGIESLPLYPEGRACRRPTARKAIDLFEDVQRHELSAGKRPAVVFTTKLSRLQRKILRLLGISGAYNRGASHRDSEKEQTRRGRMDGCAPD